jgi:hypothetical protein
MNRTKRIGLLALMLATAFTGCKDPENNENNIEIKVTTYAPTEITATTAQCGGHVTATGTAKIAELGVCWGTEENPVATDSHLSTTVTNEPFNCRLEGLLPETQYHVRAYALYESEYYYGEDNTFTTLAGNGGGDEPEPDPETPEGLTQGFFSVSATLQVRFSQGNLQYQASTGTWRFAERQSDYIGEGNANINETYDGWIDLFGWGTSGYNHGANAYQPWSTSEHYSDYYAYGNGRNNLYDQTGQADWGYNAISNGGNTANQWRTLTSAEWEYLFNNHQYGIGNVNGVGGVILLPDSWTQPSGCSFTAGPASNNGDWTHNSYTLAQWANMEAAGAVFLPAAGVRDGTNVFGMGSNGVYWSSTPNSESYANLLDFRSDYLYAMTYGLRHYGFSVRLVRDRE